MRPHSIRELSLRHRLLLLTILARSIGVTVGCVEIPVPYAQRVPHTTQRNKATPPEGEIKRGQQ
jgi:hypothetical protein